MTRNEQQENKPELLATAADPAEARRLLEAGADALSVGEQRYGLRLPGDFSLEQIGEVIELAHGIGRKVYVVVNNIMHNAILPDLPGYLERLARLQADAVVFGDPAVLMAMKQAGVSMPLHWNTEMTSTNYVTANYWSGKGAVRAVLARELNMEQVIEFKANTAMEVQVQVHGIMNIFQSKRTLVSNYLKHQGRDDDCGDVSPDRGMVLVEGMRPEQKYPVYEDRNGTHIMSAEDLCMLDNLPELLEAGIDSLKIEGLMKSPEYNETVVRIYRQALDCYLADPDNYEFNEEWLDRIRQIQDPRRELTYGFYYKEQVY